MNVLEIIGRNDELLVGLDGYESLIKEKDSASALFRFPKDLHQEVVAFIKEAGGTYDIEPSPEEPRSRIRNFIDLFLGRAS